MSLVSGSFRNLSASHQAEPQDLRWLLALILGCLAYFLATRQPFYFELIHQAYLFYPASAVALGLCLMLGPEACIGVAAVALLVNVQAGLPWPETLLLSATQTLEPFLASTLLLKVWPLRRNLVRIQDLLRFLGVALACNFVFSAFIGTLVLGWHRMLVFQNPMDSRLSWFLGDLAPILCITPFLLTVVQGPLRRWLHREPLPDRFAPVLSRRPLLEGGLLLFLAFALIHLTYGSDFLPEDWRVPLRFACFLPAIWAALRLGLRGAAGMLVALSLGGIAILWFHTRGHLDIGESRMVQIFMVFLGLATLTVGVTVEESHSAQMRYRGLVEESADGLLVIDGEGRILAANGAARSISGRSRGELWVINYAALLDPAELATRPLDWTRLYREGRVQTERTVRRPDGSAVPVEVHACVLADRTVQITLRDIRERRDAEAERLDLARQLAQAQKMEAVGTLAGGISHDFNNLLTIVLTHLEMLKLTGELNPQAQARVDTISAAAQRGADITRQLMSFSRRGFSSPSPLDLRVSLEEARVLLRSSLDPRIQLHLEAPPNLPKVKADPTQIHQILLNLCLNARDAMPEGGELTLRAFAQQSEVVLEVQDTGRGMDEETRIRVFDPFFTTKEVGKGTGLGLTMVFGLVQQNGGWIRVESEPGKGSSFRMGFPALQDRDSLPTGESGPLLVVDPESPPTLLFVDDEPALRQVCQPLLETQGYRVILAEDGEAALTQYEAHRHEIQLIILDLAMPKLSGAQVLELIRRQDPGVRVLVCSGYARDTEAQDPRLQNLAGFLQKPYRARQLLDAVRRALAQPLETP